MRNPSHLLKSRHGVYYFRWVLPSVAKRVFGLQRTELRCSLKTKDRRLAKRRLFAKCLLMTSIQEAVMAAEADFDKSHTLLLRGMELLSRYGENLFDDPHRAEAYHTEFSEFDMRAFAFASEYNHGQKSPPSSSYDCEPAETPKRPVQRHQPLTLRGDDAPAVEALDAFARGKALSNPRHATIHKYCGHVELFFKFVSEGNSEPLTMASITTERLRKYAQALPRFPARLRRNDPRKIEEIISNSPNATIAPKTRFSHAQSVHMFLQYCQTQQLATPEGFEGVLKQVLKKPKIPKKDQQDRAFTDDDLRKLFAPAQYVRRLTPRPSDYWLPLLALYTGARQGELCQLRVEDVASDDGILILKIRDDGIDMQVKTEASVRSIPLHPTLIQLGFLHFHERARVKQLVRLFPDERRSAKGEFSAFSKRFSRFRKGCGVEGVGKTFHSFRHTMLQSLYGSGSEEYVVQAITGHNFAGPNEGLRSYAPSGPTTTTKLEVLAKLHFPSVPIDYLTCTSPHCPER